MPVAPEQKPADTDANSKQEEEQRLQERMAQIGRKLIVLSGKGGVGKSTVAANLAAALSAKFRVGLLDVDIHGPSIPKLMGLEEHRLASDGTSLLPAMLNDNLAVMSIGFLLAKRTDAVVWRGPLKYGVIRQFLSDVNWGPLDFLVIDCPPGTGDEPLSVSQMVGEHACGVIVTTPQELAIADVRRCVTFCRQVSLPIAGIVENMSGFMCPHCGTASGLFGQGGGQRLAGEMGVTFLGSIPVDPSVVFGGDTGNPFAFSAAPGPVMNAFSQIVDRIVASPPAACPDCRGSCSGKHDGAGCQHDSAGCGHDHDSAHRCSCH